MVRYEVCIIADEEVQLPCKLSYLSFLLVEMM